MSDANATPLAIAHGLQSSGTAILSPSDELRAYTIKHLPIHLSVNRQEARLYRILTDIDFIKEKIFIADAFAMIEDYDLAIELDRDRRGKEMSELLLAIRTALLMSSNALDTDCEQAYPHLFARLIGSSSL